MSWYHHPRFKLYIEKAMLYNSISASCVPMAYFWVLQKINQHDVSLEKNVLTLTICCEYSTFKEVMCRNSCCFLKPDRIGQKLAENLEVEKRSIHRECVKVCIFFSSILCIDNRIKLSWMKRIMLLNFSLWWLWKTFFLPPCVMRKFDSVEDKNRIKEEVPHQRRNLHT